MSLSPQVPSLTSGSVRMPLKETPVSSIRRRLPCWPKSSLASSTPATDLSSEALWFSLRHSSGSVNAPRISTPRTPPVSTTSTLDSSIGKPATIRRSRPAWKKDVARSMRALSTSNENWPFQSLVRGTMPAGPIANSPLPLIVLVFLSASKS